MVVVKVTGHGSGANQNHVIFAGAMDIITHYTSLRPYLFSIAYNITGQVQEAEDIVQDAFEDVLKKNRDDVQNARSYFTRIVMNKAIDRLGYLKKQRAQYPALWLPEPYVTQTDNNIDILPYAFLHLMEALNPVERAVFILRESFDYSYEDIARICDVSIDNCRQVLHRVNQKLKPPPVVTRASEAVQAHERLLQEFLKACLSRDTSTLSALLQEDVQLYSDGGGKVVAARKVLKGISGVSKFLSGVIRKTFDKWSAASRIFVNNQPALVIPDEEGVYMVLIPNFEHGKLVKIFLMRNPDKIFF